MSHFVSQNLILLSLSMTAWSRKGILFLVSSVLLLSIISWSLYRLMYCKSIFQSCALFYGIYMQKQLMQRFLATLAILFDLALFLYKQVYNWLSLMALRWAVMFLVHGGKGFAFKKLKEILKRVSKKFLSSWTTKHIQYDSAAKLCE